MVVFRNGGILKRSEKWSFNQEEISILSYYGYLGMIFSSRLLWTTCIDNLCNKASRLVTRVRSVCKRYDTIDPKILFTIFEVKIKPLLLYGCEMWGVQKVDKVERVHSKFCKMVLNVGRTCPNFLAMSECGRFHLFVDYHLRALKYWNKLINMDSKRYAKKCYMQLYTQDQNDKQNWVTQIRKLLCSLGFGHVWFSQTVGNRTLLFAKIKERLVDISFQEINSCINNFSPEYLNYHPFLFERAPYLSSIQSFRQRRMLAMLRTYSLPLKNNLFRWYTSSTNMCNSCHSKCIEDEFHILFICEKYDDQRKQILFENDTKIRDAVLMDVTYKKFMMSCSKKDVAHKVVKYLHTVLKDRL